MPQSKKSKPYRPNLGLSLSGGGFRASFYHIGVLARMAELDMLRHVEVISTVSGGSIVGAAYYLKVKELLELQPDEEIKHKDYIKLVTDLEEHFLRAVQKNLRMRTFANPLKNMFMALPHYSRSNAIGELYEKHIYKPLLSKDKGRIMMGDLLIHPKGCPKSFHPCDKKHGNFGRRNKVPILILNATSLNSGHNWYFSATSMGEIPPRNLNFRDTDKKDRYRRVRYDEILSRRPDFSLGDAVAASAGVPGLFPPIAVSGLYQKRRVQLVDGGVFDNQGIAGLLDPDHACTDFIVSDASGQSDAIDNPEVGVLKVLANMNSILMKRVRSEMVNNLKETNSSHVAYFHLTRGLFARNIEFNEKPVKNTPDPKMAMGIISSKKDFDVHDDMQRAMAHIRTDLDSFSETEARCLEADGYQMSKTWLKKLPRKYFSKTPKGAPWKFGKYIPWLKSNNPMVLRQLKIAGARFLKPFRMLGSAAGISKSIGLLFASLPLLASMFAMLYLANWGFYKVTGYSIVNILTDGIVFRQFINDKVLNELVDWLRPLLIVFTISLIGDRFISGSGRYITTIRKLIKSPLSFIISALTRFLLPAIFAIPIIIYIHTIDRYFIRVMGRIKVQR